jgi:HD-like signal output (HDOD) protein
VAVARRPTIGFPFSIHAMPVAPQLRALDIDIPAQPQALLELSLLLAEDEVNLQQVATLIEADMALASAVLKAVNSSLYGLKGRVQTVQQAITYLGTREVSGVTYEMGLRSVFPHTVELEPVWQRAGLRGLVMGRLGQLLNIDPWVAHSAGLFEECGKAVLYRHAPDHYRAMLRAAGSDAELLTLEHAGFGVSHDALGAALCESWGVAAAAVASVRHHVQFQASGELPPQLQRPTVCALSAIAHALMHSPETADDVAARIAPQAQLDPALVQRAAARVREQLAEAAAH